MAQDQLRQAIALIKQGNKSQARQIVQAVLKQDSSNVPAWWLLANVLDDPAKKQKALQKVLSLDANHSRAQKMLASLKGNATPAKSQPDTPAKASSLEGTSNVEIEFDWTKLEEQDAKQKEVSGDDGNAIKMATYLMMVFPIIIVIGLAIFIGVPMYQNGQTTTAVTETMTNWLDAMLAGDFETAENFVCQQYGSESENYFALDADSDYEDYSADYSTLEITVDGFKSGEATAHLTGEISLIPTEGEQETTSVDAIMDSDGFAYETTSFLFILEDGQWLICDRNFRSE